MWTTVLFVSDKLLQQETLVSVASIKAAMAKEEAWKETQGPRPRKAKVDEPQFSDANLRDALAHVVRLGLLPADRVELG